MNELLVHELLVLLSEAELLNHLYHKGMQHTVDTLGEPIQKPVKRVTFSSIKYYIGYRMI